ncbi:MAG: hypothetical protein KDB27_05690 [Planctomycetales bacterium]|nr:hypothetical protein [Planctomycetales bacterium]
MEYRPNLVLLACGILLIATSSGIFRKQSTAKWIDAQRKKAASTQSEQQSKLAAEVADFEKHAFEVQRSMQVCATDALQQKKPVFYRLVLLHAVQCILIKRMGWDSNPR